MEPQVARTSRRRRRIRSPHPGVVLIAPQGEHASWRARYEDPDKGKQVKVTIDSLAVPTKEARRAWAIRKAKAIAQRRLELEGGAPRATGTALSTAVDDYFKAHQTLRPKTLLAYRTSAGKLLTWASANGITSADALTRAKLMTLREQLINEPKFAVARKGKRGERKATTARRSSASVNRELRGIRVILGYLADKDQLPLIREGDLRRATKKLPVPVERIEFLKPAEIRQLFASAAKHDAETYTATRAELRGGEAGSTHRYAAIAPLIAVTLLTGMRFGEVIDLEWRQVDLEAGEILLTGATKTKRARSVDLAVSPALAALLEALRPERASGKVWPMTADAATASMKRLVSAYDAPPSACWQILRSTCGTFLTNAGAIFGAASAYRSARQLGHSVAVAEKHYLGVVKGIPADAKTLEVAMGIEKELAALTPKS